MFQPSFLTACTLFATGILANPIANAPTRARAANASSGCTFSGADGAASASASASSCATITLSAIAVPSATTLDLTGLADGTQVVFEGETTFGYAEWEGPLVSISGKDITVTAGTGAVLNGDGSRWWDGEGSNGGKTKPKFFAAHSLTSSSITGLTIQNSPVQVYSIDSSTDLTLTNVVIDNSAGGTEAANTDCFDIGSSTGITITGATCTNQDDCVAVNSGSSISFTGGTCTGGHGLSIGSVGGRDDNTVSDVTFSNSKVSSSQNGVRIKTVSGATGSVSGVTYKDITLSGITKYGVVIEQDYENGDPTGTPTAGVPITNLTLDSVTGTAASGADNVYILCASGACSDWTWTGVSVTGGATDSKCENVPTGATC